MRYSLKDFYFYAFCYNFNNSYKFIDDDRRSNKKRMPRDGIRNKGETPHPTPGVDFLPGLHCVRYGFLKRSTDKRNGSVGGGSINRSIMIELVAKTQLAPRCPRSRPCIGNCIVRLVDAYRGSLLGINARTRALQVFSKGTVVQALPVLSTGPAFV